MLRIIGKLIVIVVGLAGLVGPVNAQVEISDSGEREVKQKWCGKGPFPRIKRHISIKNQGQVGYNFNYYYFADPSFKEKFPNRFPCIADDTVGTSGLGLSSPWNAGGFLGIEVNKKKLRQILVKEINVVEQGKRGVIDFIWKPDWAEIKARFVVLAGDEKLYTEISIIPNVDVSSWGARVVCVPGHHGFKKAKDRWISTDKQSKKLTREYASLTPEEEPWIFYFDTQANELGTGCLMYLPEEVKDIRSRVLGGGAVFTDLSFSPELRKIHLIFWRFPDSYKKPEEAYNYLKENGKDLVESLRKFKFEL